MAKQYKLQITQEDWDEGINSHKSGMNLLWCFCPLANACTRLGMGDSQVTIRSGFEDRYLAFINYVGYEVDDAGNMVASAFDQMAIHHKSMPEIMFPVDVVLTEVVRKF